MWWKYLSVILLLYTIVAGLRVPLKSGIIRTEPDALPSGRVHTVTFYGYNTAFSKDTEGKPIRIWFSFDDPDSKKDSFSIEGTDIRVLSDTVIETRVCFPPLSPKGDSLYAVNLTLDHPSAGASLLPGAIGLRPGAPDSAAVIPVWKADAVQGVHVQKGFSFPYQNILYETIRNLYFHVPMWFCLLFLFIASVWNSLLFLFQPNIAESLEKQPGGWWGRLLQRWQQPAADLDRRAAAYAEIGLLFGLLGLVTGMLWANYTWGQPWSNDIKQLMTAVALLVYVAYFILRSSFDEPEKGARLAAVYNIFAFASLVPLLYVVPRMFASLHPGATGNPALGSQDLDNTMRLVFYPAIIGWTLLGFWIAQLRIRVQRLEHRAMGLD
jgi:heme exporter protein C